MNAGEIDEIAGELMACHVSLDAEAVRNFGYRVLKAMEAFEVAILAKNTVENGVPLDRFNEVVMELSKVRDCLRACVRRECGCCAHDKATGCASPDFCVAREWREAARYDEVCR